MARKVKQKMLNEKLIAIIIVILLAGLAFWSGSRTDKSIEQSVTALSPTPIPEKIARLRQEVEAGSLGLTIQDAWRIFRPEFEDDLGIIVVKFKGTSPCHEMENESICTFYRNNFKLFDDQGLAQAPSDPPSKFIRGMNIIQLAYSRALCGLCSETGQIYFLLDKKSKEFILEYSPGGEKNNVKFKLEPKTYMVEDALKNLRLTPRPTYGVVEE